MKKSYIRSIVILYPGTQTIVSIIYNRHTMLSSLVLRPVKLPTDLQTTYYNTVSKSFSIFVVNKYFVCI